MKQQDPLVADVRGHRRWPPIISTTQVTSSAGQSGQNLGPRSVFQQKSGLPPRINSTHCVFTKPTNTHHSNMRFSFKTRRNLSFFKKTRVTGTLGLWRVCDKQTRGTRLQGWNGWNVGWGAPNKAPEVHGSKGGGERWKTSCHCGKYRESTGSVTEALLSASTRQASPFPLGR